MAQVTRIGGFQPSSDSLQCWPAYNRHNAKRKYNTLKVPNGQQRPSYPGTIPAHLHWDHSRDVTSHSTAIL